jgi:hypothetical protein
LLSLSKGIPEAALQEIVTFFRGTARCPPFAGGAAALMEGSAFKKPSLSHRADEKFVVTGRVELPARAFNETVTAD